MSIAWKAPWNSSLSAVLPRLNQTPKLTASDGASLDNFGASVALDGDTVSIGAVGGDDNGDQSGSAYLFTWTGGSWAEQAKLLASDGADLEWFGSAVALDIDTLIVGASLDWVNGVRHGSAYVFEGLNVDSIFADGTTKEAGKSSVVSPKAKPARRVRTLPSRTSPLNSTSPRPCCCGRGTSSGGG